MSLCVRGPLIFRVLMIMFISARLFTVNASTVVEKRNGEVRDERNYSTSLDSQASWRDLLPAEDYQLPASDTNPGLETRRIKPKSVFVAPSLSGCSEGYRQDNMGRCVKLVKVNKAAQLDFLLQKLNSIYSPTNQNKNSNEENSGPYHVSLPLVGVEDNNKQNNEDKQTALTTEKSVIETTTNILNIKTDASSSTSSRSPIEPPEDYQLSSQNNLDRMTKREPFVIVVADSADSSLESTTLNSNKATPFVVYDSSTTTNNKGIQTTTENIIQDTVSTSFNNYNLDTVNKNYDFSMAVNPTLSNEPSVFTTKGTIDVKHFNNKHGQEPSTVQLNIASRAPTVPVYLSQIIQNKCNFPVQVSGSDYKNTKLNCQPDTATIRNPVSPTLMAKPLQPSQYVKTPIGRPNSQHYSSLSNSGYNRPSNLKHFPEHSSFPISTSMAQSNDKKVSNIGNSPGLPIFFYQPTWFQFIPVDRTWPNNNNNYQPPRYQPTVYYKQQNQQHTLPQNVPLWMNTYSMWPQNKN